MPALFQFLELLAKIKLLYVGEKYPPHNPHLSRCVGCVGRLFLNNVVGAPADR